MFLELFTKKKIIICRGFEFIFLKIKFIKNKFLLLKFMNSRVILSKIEWKV